MKEARMQAHLPEGWMVPTMEFAGNMGAQNVYDCGGCGSLVREDNVENHRDWHRDMEGTYYFALSLTDRGDSTVTQEGV